MEDLVMFGGAFSGRRVFVTGHTGFKGAWLTLWLLDLGAHVTGYALDPPTRPSLFEALGLGAAGGSVASGAEASRGPAATGATDPAIPAARQAAATVLGASARFVDRRGDVRDRDALAAALAEAAPEVVFHLAAQPLVRRSYAEPHLTYETNVMGTVNLLEEVRETAATGRGPRAVVVVTSDKCYENTESRHAYAEGDPLGGHDPYSSSKACAELVTAAYRRSFFAGPRGPGVSTARAGNVLGGGDWGEDRLVPDCVRALTAGVPVEVRNPEAVRPWQHVVESLSGYLCLAAALLGGACPAGDATAPDSWAGAWNFGPGPEAFVTVREVADAVVAAWGTGEWRPAPGAAEQPHEAGLLVLDSAKAGRELGWRPVWSAARAVQAALRWYRDWAGGADPDRLAGLCRDDIAYYCADAAAAGAAWARAGVTG